MGVHKSKIWKEVHLVAVQLCGLSDPYTLLFYHERIEPAISGFCSDKWDSSWRLVVE